MRWAGSHRARTTVTQLAGLTPYGCSAHITNHRLRLCFFFVGHTQVGPQPPRAVMWPAAIWVPVLTILTILLSDAEWINLCTSDRENPIPCLLQTEAPKEPLSGRWDHWRVKIYLCPDLLLISYRMTCVISNLRPIHYFLPWNNFLFSSI